ncbi:MAG: DUF1850 domain-containing protein [Gammaproteobacteria bacterium]|nr:DUF1850 domain-containing protein [Gammaproteobacteria bacterium]
MSACLLVGGKSLMLASGLFSLSWTHSVERTQWQEFWRVEPAGLVIVEARISGSGAGMEPPDDAVFDGRSWRYVPDLPPLPELLLARSGMTVSAWTLCADGHCHDLAPDGQEPPEGTAGASLSLADDDDASQALLRIAPCAPS